MEHRRLLLSNRRIRDALREIGHAVRHTEFPGCHDYLFHRICSPRDYPP